MKTLMIFKTKTDRCIFLMVGMIVINLFLSNVGLYGGRTSPPLLIGAMALLILSTHFIAERKVITKIPIKKVFPINVLGLLFFVYGIQFLIPTYILYAFIFMIQLPLFGVSIEEKFLKETIHIFSQWFLFFYSVILICCFFISPLSQKQYSGILGNPNLWGECILLGIIIILYVYETTNNKKGKIALLLLFGISVAHIWFSRSRTAMLAMMAISIIYVIYVLINRYNLGKRLILLLVAIIVSMPLTYGGLTFIATPFSENLGIAVEHTSERFLDQMIETPDRYLKGINNEGSISSGRLEIWEKYISEISWIGHSPDAIEIWGDNEKMDAHNTFLQVAYQGGLLALIVFVIPLIANIQFFIKQILHKKVEAVTFFSIACLAYAGVYMLLSSSFGPYNSFSMIGFWLFSLPSCLTNQCKEVKLNLLKNLR